MAWSISEGRMDQKQIINFVRPYKNYTRLMMNIIQIFFDEEFMLIANVFHFFGLLMLSHCTKYSPEEQEEHNAVKGITANDFPCLVFGKNAINDISNWQYLRT